MQIFDPVSFISKQTEAIKNVVGEGRALIAVSGGVDSTTSGVLTHKAIGENLICVMLDDAFMREGEPERVAEILSSPPLSLPVKVVNVREEFLEALSGLRDAEEKRKRFRETFYEALSRIAKEERCEFLVQGTILADIIETVGGIKTQHNILDQIGIRSYEKYGFKVVEPLASLLKWQVRRVARELGIPKEISERQPFPGPGLSVRVVGLVNKKKLDVLKKATSIVERELSPLGAAQYFAAIIENDEELIDDIYRKSERIISTLLEAPAESVSVKLYKDKATGIKDKKREYGRILGFKTLSKDGSIEILDVEDLLQLQARLIGEMPSIVRVLCTTAAACKDEEYSIIVRAVETEDFLTAKVSKIPKEVILRMSQKIIKSCDDISEVLYDVTPKPPATIEME